MPSVQKTALIRYKEKVEMAQRSGYSNKAIIDELLREKATIMPRCTVKMMTLAQDRNIYKKREAARAAYECIEAIDFLVEELQQKEINA